MLKDSSYKVIYESIGVSHQRYQGWPQNVTIEAKSDSFDSRLSVYWARRSCLDITDYTLKKLMNLALVYEMRSFKCMGRWTKHPYRKWFLQCVMHKACSTTYACYCISNLTQLWRWDSRTAFPPLAWQNTCIISVVITFMVGLILQSFRFEKHNQLRMYELCS